MIFVDTGRKEVIENLASVDDESHEEHSWSRRYDERSPKGRCSSLRCHIVNGWRGKL
jgi:hypothetical protein